MANEMHDPAVTTDDFPKDSKLPTPMIYKLCDEGMFLVEKLVAVLKERARPFGVARQKGAPTK